MQKKIVHNAIMASFVADALSLGVHWVYNVKQIQEKYGRLDRIVAPELAVYHQLKNAGEFTHYGDQMMVLLESVSAKKQFNLNDFCGRWQSLFASYAGYKDQATKATLSNMESGSPPETAGSGSSDLAGAARTPPLFAAGSKDEEQLIAWAKQQTAMTHNSGDVVNAAEWMVRTAARILNGQKPSAAVNDSLDAMPAAAGLHQWVASGLESRDMNTGEAIGSFGQMCSVDAALPSAVHLVVKYENNFKEAMIENVMAGGDSSARGILAGFLIAAHQGVGCIPPEWIGDMTASGLIQAALAR